MAEFGTPLLADDVLRLSGIAQGYTNERMGRANALRGLTGLRSISGPSTGIDASLRALSPARDDEIIAQIHSKLLQETTTDSVGAEIPIRSQKEYEARGRELYPEYWNLYAADLLKLFRQHKTGAIAEAKELRTVVKGASERQASTYFNNFRKAWDSLPKDEQTPAMFNKLDYEWSSKVAGDKAAEQEYVRLREMVFGKIAARTPAAIEKARVAAEKDIIALDRARVDLKITKGEYYASGEKARDKVADKYEPYNIPDYQNMTIPEQYKLLQRAKEELISELTGLNITPAQRDQLQDELVDRLSHLEGRKDMSPKEKFIRDLYYLVDESGKSKRRKRLDKNIAKRLLIEKYKFDPEMMALSPAWADMAEEIAEGAIEGMRYEMGLDSAIVRISGSGKHEEDRLIINREPNSKEARTLINEGIIFLVTIDGELLDLQRVE